MVDMTLVMPDCFFNKIKTGTGEQTFNFDANTGNLTSRSYKKTNNPATVTESFTYDNLNRLYTYQVSGQTGYSAIYSNNVNISSKTKNYAPGYEKNFPGIHDHMYPGSFRPGRRFQKSYNQATDLLHKSA